MGLCGAFAARFGGASFRWVIKGFKSGFRSVARSAKQMEAIEETLRHMLKKLWLGCPRTGEFELTGERSTLSRKGSVFLVLLL